MNAEITMIYSEEISGLSNYIRIPQKPEKVLWEKYHLNSYFNEEGVVAVLSFDDESIKEITNLAIELPFEANSIPSHVLKSWIPKDLQKLFIYNEKEDVYKLEVPVYSLEGFSKPPYQNGFMFFHEGNWFIYVYSI
ncbi:MAG: hypothetical protein ACK4ND_20070 [Cytophagaceae bacterium]